MFDPTRTRASWCAAVLVCGAVLGSTFFLGCNFDRPLSPAAANPEPAIHSAGVLELTLVGERGEPRSATPLLGRLNGPAEIAAALRALPAGARAELEANGTCITSDAAFRAVVRQLLGSAPDPRGVSEIIRNDSWGRIKVHFLST
ncbi:MAG TPA: hypothetical protein VNM87_15245 [Candidatus Udaeobacter sp.]|nr:hypothetical protein [Candidatus Udaeobacter sp.]